MSKRIGQYKKFYEEASSSSEEESKQPEETGYRAWKILCEKGHNMKYMQSPYGLNLTTCDNCASIIGPKNHCFHCSKCEFDLCLECSKDEHYKA